MLSSRMLLVAALAVVAPSCSKKAANEHQAGGVAPNASVAKTTAAAPSSAHTTQGAGGSPAVKGASAPGAPSEVVWEWRDLAKAKDAMGGVVFTLDMELPTDAKVEARLQPPDLIPVAEIRTQGTTINLIEYEKPARFEAVKKSHGAAAGETVRAEKEPVGFTFVLVKDGKSTVNVARGRGKIGCGATDLVGPAVDVVVRACRSIRARHPSPADKES